MWSSPGNMSKYYPGLKDILPSPSPMPKYYPCLRDILSDFPYAIILPRSERHITLPFGRVICLLDLVLLMLVKLLTIKCLNLVCIKLKNTMLPSFNSISCCSQSKWDNSSLQMNNTTNYYASCKQDHVNIIIILSV
jgi:hypothetical protein